jgi:hypothetical protein
LFAAAGAGQPQAVARVLALLEPASIERGEMAPSDMGPLVEAVAAHHRPTIAAVTDRWPEPVSVAGHPWFEASWIAALRHLEPARVGALGDSVDFLAAEADVVAGGRGAESGWSWMELTIGEPGSIRDVRLRRLAQQPCSEVSITADDVTAVPHRLLRALRGRYHLLDGSAQHALALSDPDPVDDPYGVAILVEVSQALGLGLSQPIAQHITDALANGESSWSVFETALTLLTDWVVP